MLQMVQRCIYTCRVIAAVLHGCVLGVFAWEMCHATAWMLSPACSVPNIPHMWSAYASRDRFHIIMEFCERGNLLEWLKAAAVPASEDWLASTVSNSKQVIDQKAAGTKSLQQV